MGKPRRANLLPVCRGNVSVANRLSHNKQRYDGQCQVRLRILETSAHEAWAVCDDMDVDCLLDFAPYDSTSLLSLPDIRHTVERVLAAMRRDAYFRDKNWQRGADGD